MQLKLRVLPLLMDNGFTREEIARLCGWKLNTINRYLSVNNLCNDPIRADEDRAFAMASMYRAGKTLNEIGEHFDLTRERVRQILTKRGITKQMGGQTVATAGHRAARWTEKKRVKNASCQRSYGCDYETVVSLNQGKALSAQSSRTYAYSQQKASAGRRCVKWEMTFPEWCRVWDESGKFPQRGRGKAGYCMARKGDVGAYSADNVYITTIGQNASDSYKFKPHATRNIKNLRDENGLTPREREVWTLANQGYGASKIGGLLGIQAETVSQHILNARARLREAT